MSRWTYIHGIIKVWTPAESDAAAMFMAQTVINHLPRITGSERDAQFYCIRPVGYTESSSTDEFNRESNLCNSDDREWFDIQPYVLIALDGSLRDRTIDETLRETVKALRRLSTRLSVEECLISVKEYGKEFIFNNPEWIIRAEVNDWAYNLINHNKKNYRKEIYL